MRVRSGTLGELTSRLMSSSLMPSPVPAMRFWAVERRGQGVQLKGGAPSREPATAALARGSWGQQVWSTFPFGDWTPCFLKRFLGSFPAVPRTVYRGTWDISTGPAWSPS